MEAATQLTTQAGQPQWFAAPSNVISINIAVPMQAEAAQSKPIDAINKVNAAHVANITVNLKFAGAPGAVMDAKAADSGGSAPLSDQALTTDQSFNTHDTQMATIRRLHAIHEQLDVTMSKGFSEQKPPLPNEVARKATQVAHQVMAELVRGNMALRIAPDDLNTLFSHIRDHALQYINGLKNPADFCADTMKKTIMNHPKVQKFKEKHDPRHGHWTNMKYHPDTGVPSKTVLSAHMEYRGQADYHSHGAYIESHPDH